MQKYLIVVEKANNNYSTFSPDVPGCITTGNTIDETIQNMHEALELYLEESDYLPESKGLQYYLNEGLLNSDSISEEYLISSIDIRVPAIA